MTHMKALTLSDGFRRRVRWNNSRVRKPTAIVGLIGVLPKKPWRARSTGGETLSSGHRIDDSVCIVKISKTETIYGHVPSTVSGEEPGELSGCRYFQARYESTKGSRIGSQPCNSRCRRSFHVWWRSRRRPFNLWKIRW